MAEGKSFLEWLWPSERRQGKRQQVMELAAYYWDGAEPRPHRVRDISGRGMYLLTEQRWYRNTLLQVTLVRSDKPEGASDRAIRVSARVVRSGKDGVGFAFVFAANSRPAEGMYDGDATRQALKKFLAGMDCKPSAEITSAVSPLLLVPVLAVLDVRVISFCVPGSSV